MQVLRLRRVGNSLGLFLPKELVDAKRLGPGDPVRVDLERATRLDDVFGSLRKYRGSVRDWNEATHDGEAP